MKNVKLLVLVLLPLLLGWLMNEFIIYLPITAFVMWILNIGVIVYWFWVGKQFGQLSSNKLLNFLLGNIIWAISFALFLWQFLFTDDLNRNFFVAGISQYYILLTIMLPARFASLTNGVIEGTQVLTSAYISMILIFAIGFMYGVISLSRSKRNTISNENSEYSR